MTAAVVMATLCIAALVVGGTPAGAEEENPRRMPVDLWLPASGTTPSARSYLQVRGVHGDGLTEAQTFEITASRVTTPTRLCTASSAGNDRPRPAPRHRRERLE